MNISRAFRSVLAAGLAAFLSLPAWATQPVPYPLWSGPADPSQAQYWINYLAGTINQGSITPLKPGALATDGSNASQASLGNLVTAFQGLQFGLAQGSLSSPGGTMVNYAQGDSIVAQCTGVTFSVPPVIGVTLVSGGVITGYSLSQTGITTGPVPSGSAACSQNTTTGTGTGLTFTASLGLVASSVNIASLGTGGTNNNGNFILNNSGTDPNSNTTYAGNEGTFVGDKAGAAFTGYAVESTAFGHNACGNGGTGAAAPNTTCLGGDAGRNLQGAASNGNNTLVGQGAGRNVAGGWNTWIGGNAASNGAVNNPGVLSGINNVGVGFQVGNALTAGSGNLFLGAKAGSAVTTGGGNIILGATGGSDNCANGNSSFYFAVCPGAGPVISTTGGATPSTSTTTIAGAFDLPAIANAAQNEILCYNTTGGVISYENSVAGCVPSAMRFKNIEEVLLPNDALDGVMAIKPIAYTYKDEKKFGPVPFVGLIAEQVCRMDERACVYNKEGEVESYDHTAVLAYLVAAVQAQQHEIEALKARR